jgi:hypothetical protein
MKIVYFSLIDKRIFSKPLKSKKFNWNDAHNCSFLKIYKSLLNAIIFLVIV